jgi:hypothetical protein
MLIETSHVTIQGLKILGLPVVKSPKPGLIRRLYAISRLRRDLEDLEIAQCLVVESCNYVWTASALADTDVRLDGRGGQSPAPSQSKAQERGRYQVIDSYFANNRRLTGSGTGARLEYQDIDSSFLELVRTKVSDQPVVLEHDQTKRNYLHPIAGSDAAEIGAGLFMKPTR